jgi:hypothetical protein
MHPHRRQQYHQRRFQRSNETNKNDVINRTIRMPKVAEKDYEKQV